MKDKILNTLKSADQKLSKLYLKSFNESNSLVVLLFHSLFRDEKEIESNIIHPQQALTVEHFRQIISYFKQHDYNFTYPDEILGNLEEGKKYCMLSFDDGYYNNARALPVMEEFDVPALFFISTNHIHNQQCFWWDVLYRKEKENGSLEKKISERIGELKNLQHNAIHNTILQDWGDDSLQPTCELDRPFTKDELKELSAHHLVHIGNHTADHAILTNYDEEGVQQQISLCQDTLESLIGKRPNTISYPNGNYSNTIVGIARNEGLQLGITGITSKNRLPLETGSETAMQLGRFVLYGDETLLKQCEVIRSDFSFYASVRNTLKKGQG